MRRRDLIKKLVLLPLMGDLSFQEEVLPSNTDKGQKNRLIIDTHVETWNFDAGFPGVKIVIDHAGKPDLKAADCWEAFRKMFKLKRFPQVWISNSEPYEMSEIKKYPYEDTLPFYKAIYEEFGPDQLIWGTGYPRPRWELPMNKELEFVDKYCSFYTDQDRELLLGKNAMKIWKFPNRV